MDQAWKVKGTVNGEDQEFVVVAPNENAQGARQRAFSALCSRVPIGSSDPETITLTVTHLQHLGPVIH